MRKPNADDSGGEGSLKCNVEKRFSPRQARLAVDGDRTLNRVTVSNTGDNFDAELSKAAEVTLTRIASIDEIHQLKHCLSLCGFKGLRHGIINVGHHCTLGSGTRHAAHRTGLLTFAFGASQEGKKEEERDGTQMKCLPTTPSGFPAGAAIPIAPYLKPSRANVSALDRTSVQAIYCGAVLYSMVMDIGFLFPLATRVDRCYDEVTPNDMTSDVSCAFSGSMVILGGWAIILWGLARTFLLHVQVCWNQDLVTNITTLTVMIAWFAPIVGLVSALVASGVSYRMGKTCLLNARNESSLWAPLLAVSCLALFLQIVTMLYSSYIFLKSYRQDGFARNRATLPSNSTETTPSPCQQLLERVRRLCSLQWRGVMTGVSTASLVLFYCNVFWSLNAAWRAQNANPKHMLDWITCIVATNGNKTLCFSVAEKYLPSDKELYAVMCLLIGGGLCCIVFLFRFSMLRGWYHLITGKIDKHENVPFEGSGSFAHRHWHEEVPNSLGGYSVSSSTTMQELVSEEPSAVYKHGTKDGLV
ncbi:hypothetical protein KEM54_003950 [Ascosphaera aggregata]|nr:hypothetical protein KEM54_003950 [Ascosphaera aggregata]